MQGRFSTPTVAAVVAALALTGPVIGASVAPPAGATTSGIKVTSGLARTAQAARHVEAAASAVALAPSVNPAIVGETVTYRAKLGSSGARPVTLQMRAASGWVVVAKGKTSAKGEVKLSHRASGKAGQVSYRVVAPRAVVGGRVLNAVTTGVRSVAVVAQSARMELPVNAPIGSTARVTVQSVPARPGRAVRLEELSFGDWLPVATALQDRGGRATFAVKRRAGHPSLRAVVLASGGAASRTSSQLRWPPAGAIAGIDVALPDSMVYGGNWAEADDATFTQDSAGNFVVMAPREDDHLWIDTFDPRTYQRVGSPRRVSLAGWSEWGGLYSAPDGHFYMLLGNMNESEKDDVDVVAVRRYDAAWNLVGTAFLKGGEGQLFKGIYEPFAASAPSMLLVGERLVVHMGRTMYRGSDGLRHQSNFTFEVDVPSMTTKTFESIVGEWKTPYVSHSFQQLSVMHGSDLVFVDHGDAYPRAIAMHVIAGYPTGHEAKEYELLKLNGGVGDNWTGATVTGLVSGSSGVLVVGTSVPQPADGSVSNGPSNVFAITADPKTGATQTRWLTSFAAGSKESLGDPRLVTLGPDRYVLLFDVLRGDVHRTEYRLVNSSGTVLGSATFPGVFFSAGAVPAVVGSRLLWVGGAADQNADASAFLFGLDVSAPKSPKLLAG